MPLDPYDDTCLVTLPILCQASVLEEFNIGKRDIAQIYLSPSSYHNAFEEELILCNFVRSDHQFAGSDLTASDDSDH